MTPSFQIGFVGEPWTDEDGRWQKVRLDLAGDVEYEHADLTAWSPSDYKEQWLRELTAIVTLRDRGALIVSLHNPSLGSRIWLWTMWKRGDVVLFHNQILHMLEVNQEFSPVSVSQQIGEYESHTDHGQRISEWAVPTEAVQAFLNEGG